MGSPISDFIMASASATPLSSGRHEPVAFGDLDCRAQAEIDRGIGMSMPCARIEDSVSSASWSHATFS
ncbi:hypothetical protein [Mesorhizobium sp. B2-4-18]|uniref:hypothetical protein n=2 Tax=Phyllobacteriaceae TaxID=69277 RepID=UPI0015E2ECA7|nr:hypothetical protein [Mesorhizobium sp. B2-4-18]